MTTPNKPGDSPAIARRPQGSPATAGKPGKPVEKGLGKRARRKAKQAAEAEAIQVAQETTPEQVVEAAHPNEAAPTDAQMEGLVRELEAEPQPKAPVEPDAVTPVQPAGAEQPPVQEPAPDEHTMPPPPPRDNEDDTVPAEEPPATLPMQPLEPEKHSTTIPLPNEQNVPREPQPTPTPARKPPTNRIFAANGGLKPQQVRVLRALSKADRPLSRKELMNRCLTDDGTPQKKGWSKLLGATTREHGSKGLTHAGLVEVLTMGGLTYRITQLGRDALAAHDAQVATEEAALLAKQAADAAKTKPVESGVAAATS